MEARARQDEWDDPALALLMERAERAMEEAGLTPQDFLDELPRAGLELMREWYGDAFVDELVREHAMVMQTMDEPCAM